MTTRLVAIAGMGKYSPVVYELEGRRASQSVLATRAITELCAPVESVVVLGTAEVRSQRHETGFLRDVLTRDYHFMEVPKGQDEAERWALFEVLRRALDLAPIEEAGETVAPTRILFDVTHGYRTQPLFAMSVLSYMQSEWARRGVDAPELRVLYGAYDPQSSQPDVPAPLWDLTQQLTVTRWNTALDALMRYGRADDLEALARAESVAQRAAAQRAGVTGSALAPASVAGTFGKLARAFADDVALARFASLLTGLRHRQRPGDETRGSAAKLHDFLASEEMASLAARLPVLRDSLATLAAWLAPLRAPGIETSQGVAALAALAQRCVHLQRYAEAAAATREGLITQHTLAQGAALACEPNLSGYHDARVAAERAIARDGAAPTERALSAAVQSRNDLLHGGLNDQPLPAATLREQVRQHAERFAALVRGSAT